MGGFNIYRLYILDFSCSDQNEISAVRLCSCKVMLGSSISKARFGSGSA